MFKDGVYTAYIRRKFQCYITSFILGGILLLGPAVSGSVAATPDPVKVLEKVDRYRGYAESFRMDIAVIDYRDGKQTREMGFMAFIKDRGSSYLKYTKPPVDRNKILLMVDENVWFYHRKISKPLRLSARQRLLGNVSNADVARANFSYDYHPKITGEEQHNDTSCLLLELTAKRPQVAYGRILLYVDKERYKPVFAKFFTKSGYLLKTGTYSKFQRTGKEEKIAEIVIRDAVLKNNKTVIRYSGYQRQSVPGHYFNPAYLPRLR